MIAFSRRPTRYFSTCSLPRLVVRRRWISARASSYGTTEPSVFSTTFRMRKPSGVGMGSEIWPGAIAKATFSTDGARSPLCSTPRSAAVAFWGAAA